jgi:biotin-dependent carboxylase-like uncharacterized protein
MATGEVRVIEPGLLTTIQDASGRPGLGRFGVPPGGAMDAAAARLANRLVGNRGTEAVLEITLQGPTLEWTTGAHIGLAGGDLGAMTNGLTLSPGHSHRVRPGAEVTFAGARTGARTYVAVEGGFSVEPILGSTSTDHRSGFGGFHGRPLRAGDTVPFAAGEARPLRSVVGVERDMEQPIRVIANPAAAFGWFAPSAIRRFCEVAWTVAAESDRNGIRLTSGAPVRALTTGIPSLPVPVGTVQVPPDGMPIIKMVDGPVTGGYPILGVVPRLDHGRLAQASPGATLRFRRISAPAARRLSAAEDLGHIVLDEGDFAAGWAR